jgi:hypothetical protein
LGEKKGTVTDISEIDTDPETVTGKTRIKSVKNFNIALLQTHYSE